MLKTCMEEQGAGAQMLCWIGLPLISTGVQKAGSCSPNHQMVPRSQVKVKMAQIWGTHAQITQLQWSQKNLSL